MHFKKDRSIVVSANDNIIEPWPKPRLFFDHMMSLQHLVESDSVRVAETGLHLMLLLLCRANSFDGIYEVARVKSENC